MTGFEIPTLKFAVGLAGVAYSLYVEGFKEGGVKDNKTLDSIFGQFVGGVFYDFTKGGGLTVLDQLKAKYLGFDLSKDDLNHDLQKAARKAQLIATFFAAQNCLETIKAENTPSLDRNLFGKGFDRIKGFIESRDSRQIFLESVIKYLNQQIQGLNKHPFSKNLTAEQFHACFDIYQKTTAPNFQELVAKEFKAEMIEEFEYLQRFETLTGGYQNVSFDSEGFKSLKNAINNGWNEPLPGEIIDEYAVTPAIENLKPNRNGRTYDWFELVCIIFNEEYKNNEKVERAAQKQVLLEILGKFDTFGKLNTNVPTLIKQISTFSGLLTEIKSEISELRLQFDTGIERVLKEIRVSPEDSEKIKKEAIAKDKERFERERLESGTKEAGTILNDFSFQRPTKFFNRERELHELREFVLENPQPITIIKGAGGFGKTSLAEQFLKEVAPYDKISDRKIVNEIAIFNGQNEDLTFENLFFRSAELLERAFRSEGENSPLRRVFKDREMDDEQRIDLLFQQLRRLGKVWFFFDNCESLLTQDNVFKDERLTKLLELAVYQKANLRLILTTRDVPIFEGVNKISLIQMKGQLPLADAVGYLKQLAVDNKINWYCPNEAEDRLLAELAGKLRFIPKALFSFADYFSKAREKPLVLERVLASEDVFADFGKFDFEKGFTKLISEQFEILSPPEQAVWYVLSVFREPVSAEAVKYVLSDYELEDVWPLLHGSGAIIVEKRQVNNEPFYLYSLEHSAKEYIYRRLPEQLIDEESEMYEGGYPLQLLCRQQLHATIASYYESICQPVEDCYTKEQFEPYLSLFDHLIETGFVDLILTSFFKVFDRLNSLGFMKNVIPRCRAMTGNFTEPVLEAMNLFFLGNSFHLLGRLDNAIIEYDKAIKILVDEMNSAKDRIELRLIYLLGRLHHNKAKALLQLGESHEAFSQIKMSINIFEKLNFENSQQDWIVEMARGYLTKGDILRWLKKHSEANGEIDKATKILERLANEGNQEELVHDLAQAYLEKGAINQTLENLSESITEFNKVVGIYENLVIQNKQSEFANLLAEAYRMKSDTLRLSGKGRDSLVEIDKAAEIVDRLVNINKREDLKPFQAKIYSSRAAILSELGEADKAITEYENSIGLFEKLVYQDGSNEFAQHLAATYANLSNIVARLHKIEQAYEEIGKAVKIYERLVYEENKKELLTELADVYSVEAAHLTRFEKPDETVSKKFDRAIEIFETLIDEEKRDELIIKLAVLYINKALYLMYSDKANEAAVECEKAVKLFERLVFEQNKKEYADRLASAYMNSSAINSSLEKYDKSVSESGKAIKIFESLVKENNRQELADQLALSYMNKGAGLEKLEDYQESIANHDKAIKIFEAYSDRGEFHHLPDFARGLRLRSRALIGEAKIMPARKDFKRMVAMYRDAKSNPETEHLSELIAMEIGKVKKWQSDNRKDLVRNIPLLIFNSIKALFVLCFVLSIYGLIGYVIWLIVKYFFF